MADHATRLQDISLDRGPAVGTTSAGIAASYRLEPVNAEAGDRGGNRVGTGVDASLERYPVGAVGLVNAQVVLRQSVEHGIGIGDRKIDWQVKWQAVGSELEHRVHDQAHGRLESCGNGLDGNRGVAVERTGGDIEPHTDVAGVGAKLDGTAVGCIDQGTLIERCTFVRGNRVGSRIRPATGAQKQVST